MKIEDIKRYMPVRVMSTDKRSFDLGHAHGVVHSSDDPATDLVLVVLLDGREQAVPPDLIDYSTMTGRITDEALPEVTKLSKPSKVINSPQWSAAKTAIDTVLEPLADVYDWTWVAEGRGAVLMLMIKPDRTRSNQEPEVK